MNDGPIALRRRVEAPPQQLDLTPGELRADQASITDHWNHSGAAEPRFELGVDIDKNEHKRREGGPYVAPLFKSRLVSRGDLEETTGVRTDSPTCDIEGFNILLSWASCERLTVKSGDITNAYFQGCPLERLILMRQPSGGVPDVDVSADTMFVARVPIYGTCDAGRGFWKKLRHDILSTGLKENAVIRALYIYPEDGEPKLMLATHVDDMLWATKSGYED